MPPGDCDPGHPTRLRWYTVLPECDRSTAPDGRVHCPVLPSALPSVPRGPVIRRLLRPAAHGGPPERLLRAERGLPEPPHGAQRRLPVERALDHALRTDPTSLVLLRTPRGAGRRTA